MDVIYCCYITKQRSNNGRVSIGKDTMMVEMDLCCHGLPKHLQAAVNASSDIPFEWVLRLIMQLPFDYCKEGMYMTKIAKPLDIFYVLTLLER